MSAIFSNFQAGTTTTAPLVIAGTTLDSAGFANLPTIAAPDYMWLTLDPSGVAGLPEIVQVTAHTAATTTLTIVRAQQATVARQHLAATIWRHSATKADWDAAVLQYVPPAGTIRTTIATVADAGWLLFNQTAVGAQTLYPALWAVAPAAWKSGSDLLLPNLTDKVLGGAGTITLGASGGANTKTITSNNLPTHTHPVDPPNTAVTVTDPGHNHAAVSGGTFNIGDGAGVGNTYGPGGNGNFTSYQTTTANRTTGISAAVDIASFASGSNTTTATALDVTPAQLAIVYQIKAH